MRYRSAPRLCDDPLIVFELLPFPGLNLGLVVITSATSQIGSRPCGRYLLPRLGFGYCCCRVGIRDTGEAEIHRSLRERTCSYAGRHGDLKPARTGIGEIFEAVRVSEVVVMGSSVAARRLVVAGMVGLLIAGGAQAVSAHRTALSVEILSEQALLAPDGRSMTFDLSTVCDRQWTIVEASVSVTQSQATGTGSFTPNCGRIPYVVRATVPATSGTFQTGPAEATAVLIVKEGRTKQARDSASLRVRPDVSVILADQAVLEGDGAVRIDVTVTCPVSAVGQGGDVRIYDGRVVGTGTFGPTACDTLPHTVSVRVASPEGPFQAGSAEALASASITEGGDLFTGSELRSIQIVVE